MKENEKRFRVIAEDYKAVIEEAKQMGCNKIRALYNIPIENMELIVLALEKQIPKKLIKWADGTEHCPTCDCDNSCIGYGVCIDCGQKLDWSEVVE